MTEFTIDDLLGGGAGRPEDAIGQVRCGRRLEMLLGRGGMGAVYLARPVAEPTAAPDVVKVLAPELAGDPHLRERFRREWAALQKIHPHPNVVRVLDVADDDPPAIALELVRGPSLLRLIQERGRLEPRRAATLARDVARALAVVHGHGLIHRDIKPGNVLVDPGGAAKLVDFGLAKDLFRTAITKTGQVMGTAHYMAPEQFGEGPMIDPRSDLFALGATLYHLLAGRAPFVGEDIPETIELITAGEYEPLEVDAPPGLSDVLSQLLQPDLELRYGSAQDVADDLDRVLRGEPVPIVALRLEDGSARFPLLPGRRFTLGADPGCPISLPGLAPRHAQLRREARGFVLRSLKGNPTFVDGARLEAAHLLSPGARIRVGDTTLRFEHPRAAAASEPYLADARREVQPAPVLAALIATRDPRAALALIEQLAPDPAREAAISKTLAGLLPEPHLGAALARRRTEAAAEAARALALLPALAGAAPQSEPDAWLGWWFQVRAQAPVQLGPAPLPGAQVVVAAGEPEPRAADLDASTVLLIGRDRRCRLQLTQPDCARLHATVLRLHRRLIVRDEGSPAGVTLDGRPLRGAAFLDPGGVLELGAVRCRLEAPTTDPSLGPIDPAAFDLLLRSGHPSVAAACIALLREAPAATPAFVSERASVLHSADPDAAERFRAALQRAFTERVQRARALLPRLLGADAGADSDAWERLLANTDLGPQVLPAGWLAATRG